MFLQVCLSVAWHSVMSFTIYLIVPLKDTHESELPELLQNSGINVLKMCSN